MMELYEEYEELAKQSLLAYLEYGDDAFPPVFEVTQLITFAPESLQDLARIVAISPSVGVSALTTDVDLLNEAAPVKHADLPEEDEVYTVWLKYAEMVKRVKSVDLLLKAVDDLSSCDVQREQMGYERLAKVAGSGSRQKAEIETIRFPDDIDTAKDRIADRDGFSKTGTVFDTWCVLGPGELGLIIAGPNVGKTSALVDLACGYVENAEEDGVVIFFSEENAATSIEYKARCRLSRSQVPQSSKLNRLWKHFQADLIVEAHPSRTSTVDFLEERAKELADGRRIIAVIVDYLGLLNSLKLEKYDMLEDIALGLRTRLSRRLEAPVWSAIQPQRAPAREVRKARLVEGFELPVFGLEDISECWAVPQICDYVVSLNMTKDERELNPPEVRVYKAKVREAGTKMPKSSLIQANFAYEICEIA